MKRKLETRKSKCENRNSKMETEDSKLEVLPSPVGLSISHIFGWTRRPEIQNQPSPKGRGWTATALLPAGAGRVRG